MEYITHRRFKDKAICGDVNIPAMTECEERNGMIYHDNNPLCLISSENAHMYLAANEDGMGMKRGELTRKITSILRRKDNMHQWRWDRVWDDELCQKYKRPEHPDHWLWNHEFYNAEISDLEYILNLIVVSKMHRRFGIQKSRGCRSAHELGTVTKRTVPRLELWKNKQR